MSNSYSFRFTRTAELLTATLRSKPPKEKARVRGHRRLFALHALSCVMLGLGTVGFGFLATWIFTGRTELGLAGFFCGIILFYIVLFGNIFFVVPVSVRRALAARANQGEIELRVDAQGVQTQAAQYTSTIAWAGVEGLTRNKQGFVLWFGGSRLAIPFTAFQNAAGIDAFETDARAWLEATR